MTISFIKNEKKYAGYIEFDERNRLRQFRVHTIYYPKIGFNPKHPVSSLEHQFLIKRNWKFIGSELTKSGKCAKSFYTKRVKGKIQRAKVFRGGMGSVLIKVLSVADGKYHTNYKWEWIK